MRGDIGGEMTPLSEARPEPKLIYGSYPMTGYDEFNREVAEHLRDYIEDDGSIAIIPGDGETYTDEEMETWTPMPEHLAEWMRKDVELLLTVDEVWLAEGWEESRGCTFEVLIALELGIPVITEHEGALHQGDIEWAVV